MAIITTTHHTNIIMEQNQRFTYSTDLEDQYEQSEQRSWDQFQAESQLKKTGFWRYDFADFNRAWVKIEVNDWNAKVCFDP